MGKVTQIFIQSIEKIMQVSKEEATEIAKGFVERINAIEL